MCTINAAILVLSVVWTAAAQILGMEAANMPIEASAKPATALTGMPVKIVGKTEVDGKRFEVKAVVAAPAGAPVALVAKINQTGEFEFAFDKTGAPGKYTVKLLAPDGKGAATVTFNVGAPAAVFASFAETVSKSLATVKDAASSADKLVKQLPPSDAQSQVLAQADKIKQHLAADALRAAPTSRKRRKGCSRAFRRTRPTIFSTSRLKQSKKVKAGAFAALRSRLKIKREKCMKKNLILPLSMAAFIRFGCDLFNKFKANFDSNTSGTTALSPAARF